MKKFVAVLSAAAMMTSLAACGSTADTANTAASSANTAASAAKSTADTAAADSYKVAIVQQLDHASLDEIRVAIEKELDAKAAEKGITIEYKDFNGQNDATTLNQIGTEVVADGYDAIIPIATLAAQCMTTAAESTKTPVIYAAISDPAAADLTDIDYVTGTSDALNTQSIMDMMFAVQPDIQTVGLLYSNSEANSTTPIAEAKAYLDAKGIAYVEKTGNTNDNPMLSVADMNAKCRRLDDLGLVVIDYLQLMTSAGGKGYAGENRQQVVSDISRMLKIMAKELNVPVICLSQLSRASEKRDDKRPMLSDLRESGAIEQDADIVLFLYRDDYYNEDSEKHNIAECIVAKNRHGETGKVELRWMPEYTQFSTLDTRYDED